MARQRTDLQTILENLLGTRNVYYQPPEDVHMKYPAIVYSRDRSWDILADNNKYILYKGYMITFIDYNPDNPILDQIELLDMCSFNRHYEADGLNHDVFLIYF